MILIGDAGVGKTSITFRFVENRFLTNYITTLGVNILRKTQTLGDATVVNWIIWDMGGQDSYESYRKKFYGGTAAAFLLFDLTNAETFQSLENHWLPEIQDAGINLDTLPVFIIANKMDLEDQIQVTEDEIQAFCLAHNFDFIMTSAKDGTHVEEAFEMLAYKYLKNM
jgi:small GTP-binding protein